MYQSIPCEEVHIFACYSEFVLSHNQRSSELRLIPNPWLVSFTVVTSRYFKGSLRKTCLSFSPSVITGRKWLFSSYEVTLQLGQKDQRRGKATLYKYIFNILIISYEVLSSHFKMEETSSSHYQVLFQSCLFLQRVVLLILCFRLLAHLGETGFPSATTGKKRVYALCI